MLILRACVCRLPLIIHPIIDRTMDFRALWRFVVVPPLAILLFYSTLWFLTIHFRELYLLGFHYAYTFALLYLIAGPPETNPSPRSTSLWKLVVIWALLSYLKCCELCILQKHNIFEFYWVVYDALFNLDVVMLRKMGQRGHYMFEKCADDLRELLLWFAFPPRLGTRRENSKWTLVAACRSSNHGFDVDQFYQVTLFDVNVLIDDQFLPDHSSTLRTVEVRDRNPVWYTIVIWRMSLLNHGQWKLHEFDFDYGIDDQQRLIALFVGGPHCFESNGVVFVCLVDHICIYDTRLDVAVHYDVPDFGGPRSKGMMICMGRMWKKKDTLGGWKVRVIDARTTRYEDRPRLTMTNRVFQMTLSGARLISKGEIVFGRGQCCRIFRTSVGCGLTNSGYGQTMIYDATSDRWLYWPDFDNMLPKNG